MKKFAFGASKFFLGSVFGCVFVLLLFFTQCTYAKKQTFLLSNIALLLFGIALFVLFLSLDRLQQVKLSWRRPTVSSDVLIYGLCLLLFSAQLYISYNIYFETGWDAGLLTENARNLMHKHSVDIRYFSNYPNNLLYFFFELFVFKLNKYFSIFSDTQQALCVITVNCALNTLSCLLVYKTGRAAHTKAIRFFRLFSRGTQLWAFPVERHLLHRRFRADFPYPYTLCIHPSGKTQMALLCAFRHHRHTRVFYQAAVFYFAYRRFFD